MGCGGCVCVGNSQRTSVYLKPLQAGGVSVDGFKNPRIDNSHLQALGKIWAQKAYGWRQSQTMAKPPEGARGEAEPSAKGQSLSSNLRSSSAAASALLCPGIARMMIDELFSSYMYPNSRPTKQPRGRHCPQVVTPGEAGRIKLAFNTFVNSVNN